MSHQQRQLARLGVSTPEPGCWHTSANWVTFERQREGDGKASMVGTHCHWRWPPNCSHSHLQIHDNHILLMEWPTLAKVHFYARQTNMMRWQFPSLVIYPEIWSCFKNLILLKFHGRGKLGLLNMVFDSPLFPKLACQYLKKLTSRQIQRLPGSTYALTERL